MKKGNKPSSTLRASITEGDVVEIESGGSEEFIPGFPPIDSSENRASSVGSPPSQKALVMKRHGTSNKSVRISAIPETIGHADDRVDRSPISAELCPVPSQGSEINTSKHPVHHASFALHAHKRGSSETGDMFMGMTLKNLSIRDENVHKRRVVKLGILSPLFELPFENESLERNYVKICFASAKTERLWFSGILTISICIQLSLQLLYSSSSSSSDGKALNGSTTGSAAALNNTTSSLKWPLVGLKCVSILLLFVLAITEHFLLKHMRTDWMNRQAGLITLIGLIVSSCCSIESTTNPQLRVVAYANLLLFFALSTRFGSVQFHRSLCFAVSCIISWVLSKVVLLLKGFAVDTGVYYAVSEAALLVALLTLCLDTLYHYESTTRTNFVNFYAMKADQKDLENEKLQLIKQVQNLVLKNVEGGNRVDVSSPLERAVKILTQILEVPHLSGVVFSSVQDVLQLISDSSKLLQPDFMNQREGEVVDKDIAGWLKDVFAMQDMRVKHRISSAKDNPIISVTQLLLEKQRRSIFESLDANINDYDFDVFKLDSDTKGRSLFFTGFALLRRLGIIDRYNIDEKRLENFLNEIENGYGPHAYHNALHGTEVGHAVYHFVTKTRAGDYLTELDIFAAVIGGLCHDFRHPGFNNNYLIATKDDLALEYNDMAVLENFHISTSWKVLMRPDCNIIENLTPAEQKEFRQIFIEVIMATDLSKHWDLLSRFNTRIAANSELDSQKLEDRLVLLKMSIKCGDIGHPSKCQPIHFEWVRRVCEEFFNQGEQEKKRGLPVSPFMDRATCVVAKSQAGFIDYLVLPLFEAYCKFLNEASSSEIFKQLQANRAHWDSELKALAQAEEAKSKS